MTVEEIERSIPHRPPMRLLDEIVSREESAIVCRKTFAEDDFFVQGHFPDYPLVPGVIQCECCLQAGAILLAEQTAAASNDGGQIVPVATRMDAVKFKRMVRPGDTVEIQVTLNEQVSNAFYLTGKMFCGGKLTMRLDFACSVTDPRQAESEDADVKTEPAIDFLGLSGKTFLVMGVANKKSVAYRVAKLIEQSGGKVIYSVRSEKRKKSLARLLADRQVYVCDVLHQDEIDALAQQLKKKRVKLAGLVHSIAFADYPEGIKPFHETTRSQFLKSIDVSAYSLINVCNAIKDQLTKDASVVTVGISTTRMASESYGFMAPIKAALESSLAFLAKSFSNFSEVRFNSVSSGLLKTSASAGIPGYVDSYLFAEKVIPRGRAVETDEVANTAVFLLSPRSSGITAQSVVVDAGMSINYFDADIVRAVTDADL